VFNGEGDDDEIYGNAGDDTIDGGAGDDYIDGGTGQDTLTGGAGEDVFYFDSNLDSSTDPFILGPDAVGIDTITDFDADDDILLFDFDIFFIGNFATATLGLGSLSGSFAAEAFYVESEGILYIDYDGDGNLDWDDMAIAMPDLVGTLTNDDNFFTVV